MYFFFDQNPEEFSFSAKKKGLIYKRPKQFYSENLYENTSKIMQSMIPLNNFFIQVPKYNIFFYINLY